MGCGQKDTIRADETIEAGVNDLEIAGWVSWWSNATYFLKCQNSPPLTMDILVYKGA